MPRRYHYSPHDGSAHYGILNLLIGLATLLCLWNVWTAPPPATSTTRYDSNENSVPTNQNYNRQQQKQQPPQAMRGQGIGTSTPLLSTTTTNQFSGQSFHDPNAPRFLPVHTGANGQKFVLLAPENHGQESGTLATKEVRQVEFGIQQESSSGGAASRLRGISSTTTPVQMQQAKIANAQTQKHSHPYHGRRLMNSSPRGFSSPLFVETEPRSSTGVSETASSPTRLRPRWSSWIYAFAITGSIVAGGLYAKRTLERIDRWEQLSKEDSLAYDVAYTSVYNDDVISYGSFASVTSEWSGDFLDRFDV